MIAFNAALGLHLNRISEAASLDESTFAWLINMVIIGLRGLYRKTVIKTSSSCYTPTARRDTMTGDWVGWIVKRSSTALARAVQLEAKTYPSDTEVNKQSAVTRPRKKNKTGFHLL